MMENLLYLDPGTGSLLLYAIVGISTTILFALRGFWYSLRNRLFLGRKSAVEKMPDIVFHSEGGKYWQVFQPVLRVFDSYGIKYGFVTPDKNDPVFTSGLKNVVPVCPGKEMITLSYMNNIRAKVVVSTTPDLDVYMLKRSRHVEKYVHLFHAVVDIGIYELYAFDYYDILLCTGAFQKESIRSIEKNRREKPKELFDTGCTYFEYMLDEIRKLPQQRDEELTVLYSAAWGERSSVVRYGTAVIDALTSAGIRVIFRPHPQMYVSDREAIEAALEKIKGNSLVEVDRNRTAAESMIRSHAMVSDISGVIFDYAFLFEKPMFLVNSEYFPGGCEVLDVDGERIWQFEKIPEISRVITDNEIPEVGKIVKRELEKADIYRERIQKIKNTEIYNFGSAGRTAAEQLKEILSRS